MTDQPPPSQPERSRTIPDGGLAASGLPNWMQTKPEWSARRADTTPSMMDARPIPAPDTSTIDLATILTTDDLPDWLQEVARRPATSGSGRADSIPLPDPTPERAGMSFVYSPKVHVDPATKPWWTSDRIMAGLLIAVVFTIIFVLVTTIRMN